MANTDCSLLKPSECRATSKCSFDSGNKACFAKPQLPPTESDLGDNVEDTPSDTPEDMCASMPAKVCRANSGCAYTKLTKTCTAKAGGGGEGDSSSDGDNSNGDDVNVNQGQQALCNGLSSSPKECRAEPSCAFDKSAKVCNANGIPPQTDPSDDAGETDTDGGTDACAMFVPC